MKLLATPLLAAALAFPALATAADPAPDALASIVAPDAEATQLGTGMKFVEGPVWIPSEKKLVFSDIPSEAHMQWTAADGVTKLRDVEATNGNLLDLDGNLLSCQHGGRNVVRWQADGTPKVLGDSWDGKKFHSPNDLAVRSDGSIWFTDPSYGLKDRKAEIVGKNVYRLDPASGKVTMVYAGFDMPNGIAFSPDESRVYISDTGKVGKVRAFDIRDDNSLSDPVFELDVRCDGLCVDIEGNIYTTAAGGLHVFDKSGRKLGVIKTPEHPANVCFGGDDFKTLFITARTSLYSIPAKIPGTKPKAAKW